MQQHHPAHVLRGAIAALVLGGGIPAASHAGGIPVTDIPAIAQRVKMMIDTYQTARSAIKMVKTTGDHLDAITGVRNMDDVMRLRLVRQIVPNDYRQLYRCARSENYDCVADNVLDIIEEHRIEDTCAGLDDDPLRRQSCQERAIKGVIDHAIALEAMESIEERNETIERLAARIPSTTDPKELAELQARIDTEGLAIQNEALALDAARDASASYDRILAQRDREIEERAWRSRSTPTIQPINFGAG